MENNREQLLLNAKSNSRKAPSFPRRSARPWRSVETPNDVSNGPIGTSLGGVDLCPEACRDRGRSPDVYATGDTAFPEKYTHAAMATARLCVANALDGAGHRARGLLIPHCTYTDPEVASVGLIPARAAEEGIALDTRRLELSRVERAFIDGEEEGFAAIHTRKGTEEVVGATLVAAHAREMISELTLAITNKLPLEALAETVHCYPTQAEVFQRIALDYIRSAKEMAGHSSYTS